VFVRVRPCLLFQSAPQRSGRTTSPLPFLPLIPSFDPRPHALAISHPPAGSRHRSCLSQLRYRICHRGTVAPASISLQPPKSRHRSPPVVIFVLSLLFVTLPLPIPTAPGALSRPQFRRNSYTCPFPAKSTPGFSAIDEPRPWFRNGAEPCGTVPQYLSEKGFDVHVEGLASGMRVCPERGGSRFAQ
jgi:hypothetical protein